MTRDRPPEPDPDPEDTRTGHYRPVRSTSPGLVVGWSLLGLVLGWLVRPVSLRLTGSPLVFGWLPVLTMVFLAVAVGGLAWSTRQRLRRAPSARRPTRRAPAELSAQEAVNRLAIAKSCVVVGALVGGVYLGYAVSWLGVVSTLAQERMLRALVGSGAGAVLVLTALLLERSCRVRRDEG